jgi:hypothetical protein
MDQQKIEKMDLCRHLLPAPGDAVVGECLAEINRLEGENARLRESQLRLQHMDRFFTQNKEVLELYVDWLREHPYPAR